MAIIDERMREQRDVQDGEILPNIVRDSVKQDILHGIFTRRLDDVVDVAQLPPVLRGVHSDQRRH